MPPPADYVSRLVDPVLADLLASVPAVQVIGPRAVGKTTSARRLAATVVSLDREAEAAAFRADPDAALRGLVEPVLLDEWQLVPGVLPAVKRAVDADSRPGRFIITGSVRADLDADTWAGTGRVVNVPMRPLVEREIVGRTASPSLVDTLVGGAVPRVPGDAPDLRGYIELAVRGGFPDAVRLRSDAVRARWLESYLDQVVTRDADLVDRGRDPERLRRYLDAVASNTAGIVDDKRLYDAAGINRVTGVAYDQLLRNLFVLDAVPSWSSNRLQRLVSQPKRFLVDSGLAVAALRVGADDVMRDGDLLGRMLETFVAAQLRVDAAVSARRPILHHVRDQAGRHEIDLLADAGARGVLAFEVKADAAPRPGSARHLTWLRERLGDAFVAGAVLHTGPRAYELDDRIVALPIAALWG